MGLLGLATHGATNLLCKLYKQSLKANGIIRMQILELEHFILSLVRLELFVSLTKRCV